MNTLGDRDDDDTSLGGLFEEIENVGTIRRHVAGAVALEDHALDGRVEKVGNGVAADRGEEAEEGVHEASRIKRMCLMLFPIIL